MGIVFETKKKYKKSICTCAIEGSERGRATRASSAPLSGQLYKEARKELSQKLSSSTRSSIEASSKREETTVLFEKLEVTGFL